MPKKNQKKKAAVILGNPLEAKNKLSEISSNIITEKVFETVLERLEREFPDVAQEIIEEIYEENARSYISTKKKLEEIFPNVENENKNSILNSKETNNFVVNNNNSNYFKEAETNYADETDKVSCRTEKSKNEKSDYSNELTRKISGSNSNFSGNAYAGIFSLVLNLKKMFHYTYEIYQFKIWIIYFNILSH